jgi:arylsulfatase A-like enzyme/Flp pilus assembly protein TadD
MLLAALACDLNPRPTSILLVTIDTCRADRIGAYGAANAVTPTLDRLAENGALFLNATAPAPITLPSHASILTGLYPDRHGVRDNGAGRLPDEAVTLAEVLADRGWSTAAFLAAVPLDSSFGTDQGFAVYDDDFVRGDPGPDILQRLDTDQRIAAEVSRHAAPWIRDAVTAQRPWFAWVHFFDPHSPYAPPADLAARLPGASPYEAEIANVDRELAKLLAEIDDRTVVAVVADHGESLGEHGESTHGFFLYESVMHVPWILRAPDVPPALRVETPVSLVRVMPTLLDLVGVPAPDGIDGTSATALLRDGPADAGDTDDAGDADAEPVFAEALFARMNFGWSATRSLRTGRWKLIESPDPELFDLQTDAKEQRNLAAEHPDRVDEMRGLLADHFTRGGVLAPTPSGVGPEMLARLEGLGYLGAGGSGEDPESLWGFDRLDPRDGLTIFREVERLPTVVLSGDREEANAFVDRLRAMDPGNAAILKKILKIRVRARHWEEAKATADELLALVPDDVDVWRDAATVAMHTDERTEAIARLTRVMELAPDDETGRRLLATAVNEEALAFSHSGKARAAVDLLRRHLPTLPDDVDTLNNLAWILADHSIDAEAALQYARHARDLAPDDPVVLDTFGWAAIRAGRAAEAVEPLRQALAATDDAEVRAHLGIALAMTGERDEGRELLRAAVREERELRNIPEAAKWMR